MPMPGPYAVSDYLEIGSRLFVALHLMPYAYANVCCAWRWTLCLMPNANAWTLCLMPIPRHRGQDVRGPAPYAYAWTLCPMPGPYAYAWTL